MVCLEPIRSLDDKKSVLVACGRRFTKNTFLELRYFLKITLVRIEAFFVDLCYNIKNQAIINHAFLRRDIMKGIV